MTNTIPNVQRELLADLLGNDHDKRIMAERHLLAMLANAPSPAGVDGLPEFLTQELEAVGQEAVAKAVDDQCSSVPVLQAVYGEAIRKRVVDDAQAIIDGLRGEVDQLQSMLATVSKAGIRIRTERDKQAKRIGELEGLLRDSAELIKHGVFEDGYCCCGSSVDSHGLGDGHSPVDALAYHAGQVCERIDAALSAGKEDAQ